MATVDRQHSDILPEDAHALQRWVVSDASALAALSPTAGDAGKVAMQADGSAWWVWTGGAWLQLADRAWVMQQLASGLAGEADVTWVTQQLAQKADASALAAKADTATVSTLQTQVAAKADTATVSTLQTQVAAKADQTWVTQQLASVTHWRITQALNAQGAGTLAFHIGSWTFEAGAQLAGLLILGTQGAPGSAIAELVRDDTGTVVASWMSTASLGAVSLSAPVTLTAGIHSLRVRGQLDNSQPLLRGIDWTVT